MPAKSAELKDLSSQEQEILRDWFRNHWERGVRFNAHLGVSIEKWDDEGAVFRLPFADHLSAHDEIFHGGVVATLIDTCGCGAVMAGHDFTKGSRCTTISMAVNYLSVAPSEDLRAEAVCTRRGRTANYAEVKVYGASSSKLVAQGLVTVNVSGTRTGIEKVLARHAD
jgi:uncharacterized protein (TIGR00369 family)